MEELIIRYLTDTLNEEETEQLLAWLQDDAHRAYFNKMVAYHYQYRLLLQDDRPDQEYERFLASVNQKRIPERPQRSTGREWFARAAIFIGIACTTYYLVKDRGLSPQVAAEVPGISLKQADGSLKTIWEDGRGSILSADGKVIAEQTGTTIDYRNITADPDGMGDPEIPSYNQLSVPNGKRLQLVLSDGSMVFLNSGSSLRYPVRFTNNGPREVFLDGEAFFEVEKDVQHPFLVHGRDLEIKVLGTKFNVSAYPGDGTVNTTLAQGSVEIRDKWALVAPVILEPEQRAIYGVSGHTMEVAKVNVDEYIAWTRGELWFQSRTFPQILKVLERHFDVTIINAYPYLDGQSFFARFNGQTLEEVLQLFQNSEPFDYVINGKTITIVPPQTAG